MFDSITLLPVYSRMGSELYWYVAPFDTCLRRLSSSSLVGAKHFSSNYSASLMFSHCKAFF